MNTGSKFTLRENTRGGGYVQRNGKTGWHLEIPAGKAGKYRLAQLDDYHGIARNVFPWSAPIRINLEARASSSEIPGTWGFGLWNDPFGLAIVQGSRARFPTLPNAAWFFFASEPNYLSLRGDLQGYGQLAATFQSPGELPINLLLGLPLFSLVFLPIIARRLRGWLRRNIQQDCAEIDLDPTVWHAYEIERQRARVIFRVDGDEIYETRVVPHGSLGLVIWVDNQYAGWPPDGRIRYGTLANREEAWLEIADLAVSPA